MVPAYAIDAVDRLLRDLTGVHIPFGNKLIVCGGDFRQILPIAPGGSKVEIISRCIKSSQLWFNCESKFLTKNMRTTADEREFADWLYQLGGGLILIEKTISPVAIQIPQDCVYDGDIIEYMYGNETLNAEKITEFVQSVILCPKNRDCTLINDEVINLIEGDAVTYHSADSIIAEEDDDADEYSIEFINSLTPSGLPPHELKLKKGVIVMLLRNLHIGKGLVNGTRLLIKHLQQNSLHCEVLTGELIGEQVLIPRMDLDSSDPKLPFSLKRRQFPIRVAFAITINKCQGQTFEKVLLYLSEPVFAHGQLYVAFSRVKRRQDIKVKVIQSAIQGKFLNGTYTSNIVYKDIL